MDLAHKIIIALLVILIAINIFDKKQENAGSVSGSATTSTEAVANIAKVYADSTGTATFNNVTITGNLNPGNFKGIIVAWSGAISDIPTGWGFCDGRIYKALDGTDLKSPDLRSSFIIGASKPGTSNNKSAGGPDGQPSIPNVSWLTPRAVNNQGGEETHTLTVGEMPQHSHSTQWECMGADPNNGRGSNINSSMGWNCQNNARYTDNTGGNGPHNNMPPYYALAYIIKL